MEALEAINKRRSIRRFKSTPVEDEKIELVLEAARQAPSWGNTQCWRFVVVRDADMINRLADTGFGAGGGGANSAGAQHPLGATAPSPLPDERFQRGRGAEAGGRHRFCGPRGRLPGPA